MTQQQKGNISIHAQNIMPIIKRWLYSDKDIFVREMVSNGCDAITKEKMLHPDQECDYRVTVTLDKEAKEIRFSDNGIGMTAEEVEKYINQVPMRRGCQYDDIANAMVFLLSDESSYMTGQAINVTGGQQMQP